MLQILTGLIIYLLHGIYFHVHYREKVSIEGVRRLRMQIRNELKGATAYADTTKEPDS